MLVNAPITDVVIENLQTGLPSIHLLQLNDMVRVDKNMGESFLVEKIRHAMDIINHHIIAVPLPLNAALTRFYTRAVLFEAAALISEENADFDTTASGLDRGEQVDHKAQRLRRLVNHCIADMTGRTRNRVRLV
jgi:hypothetical protein